MAMTIDGSNGLTFNNATVQNSGSKVLQVVNVTYGTQTSTTTATFVDTGLTATITPLFNTSKILVLVNQCGIRKDTSSTGVALRILRGSTPVLQFAHTSGTNGTSALNGVGSDSSCYLDSPATTSATTYKTQFNSDSGTSIVFTQVNGAFSSITLMEIAV
jgi:hypothetical protein